MQYDYTVSFDSFSILDHVGQPVFSPSLPPMTLSQVAAEAMAGAQQTALKVVYLPDGTQITITIAVGESLKLLSARLETADQPQSFSVYSHAGTTDGTITFAGGASAEHDSAQWSASLTWGLHATLTQVSP